MSQETKTKIEKLQKAIDSPATPENVKKALKNALEKLQKDAESESVEIDTKKEDKKKSVKKVAKAPKNAAKKATKPKKSKVEPADMGKLKALINSLKNKKGYEFLKKLDLDSVKRDAERKAKKAGKRISADGNVYYEYRTNRTDVNRKIKLAEGGEVGSGMLNFVLNEMSSGFIVSNSSAKTYKEADAIRSKMISILQKEGDRNYSLKGAVDLVKEASIKTQKMANGGDITGENVNITDKNSLFKGESGVVTGTQGKMLMVKILVDGGERTVMVNKKGVKVIK